MIGEEARTKSSRFLLAPTINLHRSPLAARNFECYSEDPLLAGRLAAAYVRGVQARGVAAYRGWKPGSPTPRTPRPGTRLVVIDAETFEQTDVIEPLSIVPDINAVAVTPGALWVATDTTGILQRFDLSS